MERIIWDVVIPPSSVAVRTISKPLLVLMAKVFILSSDWTYICIYLLYIFFVWPNLMIYIVTRLRGGNHFRNIRNGDIRDNDATNPTRRLRKHYLRLLSRRHYHCEWHELCGMRCHWYWKLQRVLFRMLSWRSFSGYEVSSCNKLFAKYHFSK